MNDLLLHYQPFKDIYNEFKIIEEKKESKAISIVYDKEQYQNVLNEDEKSSTFSIIQTDTEWRINAESLLSQIPEDKSKIIRIYAVSLGALALLKSDDIMGYQKSGVDQSTIQKIIQLQHIHTITIQNANCNAWTELDGPNIAFIRTITEDLLIIGKLGKGGFKEVFDAANLTKRRREALARGHNLQREFKIMQTLQEKNIPYIVTPYTYQKVFYERTGRLFFEEFFTMEHCAKGSLDRLITQNPPSKQVIIKFVIQIAEALQSIHEAGYVHKDIKLNNILVSEGKNGVEIRVADFGLTSTVATPSRLYGTNGYGAPEAGLLLYEHPVLDNFALGILLYYLVYNKKYYPKVFYYTHTTKSELYLENKLRIENYQIRFEQCKSRIRSEREKNVDTNKNEGELKINHQEKHCFEDTSSEAKKELTELILDSGGSSSSSSKSSEEENEKTKPLEFDDCNMMNDEFFFAEEIQKQKEKELEKFLNCKPTIIGRKKGERIQKNELDKSIFPNQDDIDEVILGLTQPNMKDRLDLYSALNKLRSALKKRTEGSE